MRGIDEQMRIRKESDIFNSISQKTPKIYKGERKEHNITKSHCVPQGLRKINTSYSRWKEKVKIRIEINEMETYKTYKELMKQR
jgi:aromatic ring hydroxylase